MSPRAFLLAACLPVAAGAAPLHKCEVPQGAYYQNVPCPQGARQTVIASPTLTQSMSEGDPGTQSLTPQAERLRRDVGRVMTVLAMYPACSESSATFKKAHAARYEGWKAKNAALIDRIRSDPEMRAALDEGSRLERARAAGKDAAERTKQARECTTDVGPAIVAGS